MKTIVDELRAHPFTQGMRPEHLDVISGCGRNVALQPGLAHKEGDPADTFYALREGLVSLEVHAPTGRPLVVQTVRGGEILGWSWLFEPYRWTFDARVVEPVRAIAFDGACLRKKAEADHELGYELMKRMARVFTGRLAATRMQLLDLYGGRD